MKPEHLPLLNACLNLLSAAFLALGYLFIKRGRKMAHRNCMIAAFYASVVFLCSYLVYHSLAGRVVFKEPAWFRPIYLVILLSHTILAVVILPMVIATLRFATQERFERHKKLARWTIPLWFYVSFTGVVIYLLLYVIFPQTR